MEIGCFQRTVIAHFANGTVLMQLMILAVGCQMVMIKGSKLVESMWEVEERAQHDSYARGVHLVQWKEC